MKCLVRRKLGIKTMINNIKKYFKVIFLVFKSVFGCAPFATTFVVFYNFFVCAFPAFIVVINTKLFDAVEIYINMQNDFNHIVQLCLILVLLYVMQKIFQIIANALENIAVFEKNISKSRINIAYKMSNLDLIQYENAEVREKQQRANYCVQYEKISQLFLAFLSVLTSVAGVISVMIILVKYSLLFLLISVLSVIPFFFVRKIRGNEFYYMRYLQAGKSRKLSYLWSLFTDKQVAKEMRTMYFGDYIIDKWIECRDDINDEIWKLRVKDAISLFVCENIETVGYVMGLLLTLVLVVNCKISIGVFCACIYAFLEVQNQTKEFLIQLGFIPEMMSYVQDYLEFVEMKNKKEKKEYEEISYNDIELKNVNFRYPNCIENALSNVNLKINKQSFVVIVGENGSGKTTLGKLLMGLYHPSSGEVLYNGIEEGKVDKKSLYKQFTVVSQKFVKYMLTLEENITISDIYRDKNEDKISLLLKNVNLDEFANTNLYEELGTEFGGLDLSGGQWQKLAIARAMYRNSRIIFFDEPTSAIDPLTEQLIFNNVLKFAEGKTAIIVSHRVSLCNFATKIIVMKKGKVEAVGTHDELMKSCEYYNKLYTNQSKWYS
ncbi:ABC transporter ATP-binding protein [Lachnospiraceae bacterium 48-33]